jgi:hypothetical protein
LKVRQKKLKISQKVHKEKADVMSSLLESVQTGRLQNAYEKYLPAVLNNSSKAKAQKPALVESKEVTGNKESAKDIEEDHSTVVDIRRLAGLK